jgi:hypothetical protein
LHNENELGGEEMNPSPEQISEWRKEFEASFDAYLPIDSFGNYLHYDHDLQFRGYLRARTETAALNSQGADTQMHVNSLVPLARFGAMVAKSHSDGDFIDAEDLTYALIASGSAVDTDGQVNYTPSIEATIDQLLKDEMSIKLPANTPVIYMDSPSFVDDFKAAIGLQDDQALEVATPQFERIDTIKVDVVDPQIDYANLSLKDDADLIALGCGVWDSDDKGTTWLFPKEWYAFIPDGLPVVDINGETSPFKAGVTDDDYRFGCLSFGFHKAKY